MKGYAVRMVYAAGAGLMNKFAVQEISVKRGIYAVKWIKNVTDADLITFSAVKKINAMEDMYVTLKENARSAELITRFVVQVMTVKEDMYVLMRGYVKRAGVKA